MFNDLSSHRRVPRQTHDVECTILDAPSGPQFSIGWSPDDASIVGAACDARAAMARSRRVRDELVAYGFGDLL